MAKETIEEIVAKLQEKLEGMKVDKAEQDKLLAELSKRISASETVTNELSGKVNELQTEVSANKFGADEKNALETALTQIGKGMQALQQENAALAKEVGKKPANDEPKPEEKATLPTSTFEVNGVEYKFVVAAFLFKREGSIQAVRVTASDALTDAELLAELVKKGSGCITAV